MLVLTNEAEQVKSVEKHLDDSAAVLTVTVN